MKPTARMTIRDARRDAAEARRRRERARHGVLSGLNAFARGQLENFRRAGPFFLTVPGEHHILYR